MLDVIFGEAPADAVRAVPVPEGAVPAAWAEAAAADGFTGARDTACLILGGAAPLLLVGLGAAPDEAAWEAAGAAAAAAAGRFGALALSAEGLKRRHVAAFAFGATARRWRFTRYVTRPDDAAPKLSALYVAGADDRLRARWAETAAVLRGQSFARALVTEPANVLTPDAFVARLAPLEEAGVVVEVLRGERLAAFPGLCAVGRGSAHPPALAVLRWDGSQDTAPFALVGKGITFDTGGICIKPADRMWEMRADMAGAAACAGAMLALALRRSPAPVTAYLALAENATGADSYRPSDVLRHASGRTIEVVDTDAEGRLVLADAIGLAQREGADAILSLATLTGSIVVALGHHMAGLFANSDALAASVAAAGAAVGERAWRMPLGGGYAEALKSEIADLRHCSPERMQPDACHAATFLAEFTEGRPWAHLDIAGVDTETEGEKRATGWGVRLIDRLVRDRFEEKNVLF